MAEREQLSAFVIMPFDSEFDAVYKELLAKPLEDAGFRVNRADNVDTPQNVLADVVRGIAEADLVVADLTTINANVFYELGLAHALDIPTVLVAHQDSSEEIPFDLRQYRTEFYDTHFQRAGAIVAAMRDLGRAHGRGEITFGSPISDHLPAARRPSLRADRKAPPPPTTTAEPEQGVSDQDADDDSEEDDRGLLEYGDEIEASAGSLARLLGDSLRRLRSNPRMWRQSPNRSAASTPRPLKDRFRPDGFFYVLPRCSTITLKLSRTISRNSSALSNASRQTASAISHY